MGCVGGRWGLGGAAVEQAGLPPVLLQADSHHTPWEARAPVMLLATDQPADAVLAAREGMAPGCAARSGAAPDRGAHQRGAWAGPCCWPAWCLSVDRITPAWTLS